MRRVTVKMLGRMKACEMAVEDFHALFGDSVEITKENIQRAKDHGFSGRIRWLATHLGWKANAAYAKIRSKVIGDGRETNARMTECVRLYDEAAVRYILRWAKGTKKVAAK